MLVISLIALAGIFFSLFATKNAKKYRIPLIVVIVATWVGAIIIFNNVLSFKSIQQIVITLLLFVAELVVLYIFVMLLIKYITEKKIFTKRKRPTIRQEVVTHRPTPSKKRIKSKERVLSSRVLDKIKNAEQEREQKKAKNDKKQRLVEQSATPERIKTVGELENAMEIATHKKAINSVASEENTEVFNVQQFETIQFKRPLGEELVAQEITKDVNNDESFSSVFENTVNSVDTDDVELDDNYTIDISKYNVPDSYEEVDEELIEETVVDYEEILASEEVFVSEEYETEETPVIEQTKVEYEEVIEEELSPAFEEYETEEIPVIEQTEVEYEEVIEKELSPAFEEYETEEIPVFEQTEVEYEEVIEEEELSPAFEDYETEETPVFEQTEVEYEEEIAAEELSPAFEEYETEETPVFEQTEVEYEEEIIEEVIPLVEEISAEENEENEYISLSKYDKLMQKANEAKRSKNYLIAIQLFESAKSLTSSTAVKKDIENSVLDCLIHGKKLKQAKEKIFDLLRSEYVFTFDEKERIRVLLSIIKKMEKQ